MIHKRQYVIELIRKQAAGTLTPSEAGQLEAARIIYDEDGFARMASEAMLSMDGDLPADPLDGWQPDFAGIRKRAGRRKKTRLLLLQIGAAAAAAVLLLLAGYLARQRPDAYGLMLADDCSGMRRDAEIPASDFACAVWQGNVKIADASPGMHGDIARAGGLVIRKTPGGILQLQHRPEARGGPSANSGIAVTTAAQQQCIVELPDGTRVRLNAGSVLEYPAAAQGTRMPTRIRLAGEALVSVPGTAGETGGHVVVETASSRLSSGAGEFVVRTEPGQTRVMLLDGRMAAGMAGGGKPQRMDCPGDMAFVPAAAGDGAAGQDTVLFLRGGPVHTALAWTKAVRTYRNVPLRQFVAETSRWLGFSIKDPGCIPAGARISTTVCYKTTRNEVFAAIRTAGVTMYEKDGMVSFCGADDKQPSGLAPSGPGVGRLAWSGAGVFSPDARYYNFDGTH